MLWVKSGPDAFINSSIFLCPLNVYQALLTHYVLDDRFRCTVDIRIMVGYYARDGIFVFRCHFIRSGSLPSAAWSRLISLYPVCA